MICLGIESTAHTFGVGIVTGKGKILANARSVFTTKCGGIHPTKAKEHHEKAAESIMKDAFSQSHLTEQDIDLIAFSQGPGLPPCLLVGLKKAREIAIRNKIPLIGVNHCIAHLEIGRLLTKAKDPVLVYVSGANTQIIAYEGRKYRVFGETLDNGIGNFLDGFARALGFGFPGGPKIMELAKKAKRFVELPYAVKGMDVSFGGIQTNLKQKMMQGYAKEDLAYSCQETVFAMVTEVTERALAHTGKREVVLGGGVACNTRLQEMMRKMCKARGAKSYKVQNEFNNDNGAMIAWLGCVQYSCHKKNTGDAKADIKPRWRTDDVEVYWR